MMNDETTKIKKKLRPLYFALFEIDNSQISTKVKNLTKELIEDDIDKYLNEQFKYLNEQLFDNGRPQVESVTTPRKKGDPLVQGTNTFYFRNEKQILEHLRDVGHMTAENIVVEFKVSKPTATNAIKQLINQGKAIKIKGRPLTVKGI